MGVGLWPWFKACCMDGWTDRWMDGGMDGRGSGIPDTAGLRAQQGEHLSSLGRHFWSPRQFVNRSQALHNCSLSVTQFLLLAPPDGGVPGSSRGQPCVSVGSDKSPEAPFPSRAERKTRSAHLGIRRREAGRGTCWSGLRRLRNNSSVYCSK